MDHFTNTHLWLGLEAKESDQSLEKTSKEKFKSAFLTFRQNASLLANEISRDLPEFTIHNESHLDALWEMASLIIGKEFEINPAETFVLGGAFLIHDLGLGLAAYPDGIDQLKKSTIWRDTLFSIFKKHHSRTPTENDVSTLNAEIEKEIKESVLRTMHASHAERLALISWTDTENGEKKFLIEDEQIRKAYGRLIGLVASSHWYKVNDLQNKLNEKIGAPSPFPSSWTIDLIKIACILRLADAIHLTSDRAPDLLRIVRNPNAESKNHWLFQSNLCQPFIQVDRLFFTSQKSFEINQANSWWLAYDYLRMVDSEIKEVDSLLSDTGRQRFTIKAIANIEDPSRFSTIIKTDGWIPIDAKIKVSDVADLVRKLGGESLYGNDLNVPLRELIQNSSDAINARILIKNISTQNAEVIVTCGKDNHGSWIEVEDNGIGMSENVLKGPFLDFGQTFWNTEMMRSELPGLESSGFLPIGKFGIGFYSAFMWGDKIQIITRRYNQAYDQTLVMEFLKGISIRPLIRKATSEEYLKDGGTKIKIWFRNENNFDQIFNQKYRNEEIRWTLKKKCEWLCPALSVNLSIRESGKSIRVINANDWQECTPSTLLSRISRPLLQKEIKEWEENFKKYSKNLVLIKDRSSGQILGRACVSPATFNSISSEIITGAVTVGGFRITELRKISGILIGQVSLASRENAVPLLNGENLSAWSSDQSKKLRGKYSEKELISCAEVIHACGGNPNNLPIAFSKYGWLNLDEIMKKYKKFKKIIICDSFFYELEEQSYDTKLKLYDNVLLPNTTFMTILLHSGRSYINWPTFWDKEEEKNDFQFSYSTLNGFIVQEFSKIFKRPIKKIIKQKNILMPIGVRQGIKYKQHCMVLENE